MFLSDLVEELRARGAQQDELDVAKKSIFADFPAIAWAVMSQPLSTAPADPDIPLDYAIELINRLGS